MKKIRLAIIGCGGFVRYHVRGMSEGPAAFQCVGLADTVRQPMTVPIWYPTSRWRQGEVVATETFLLTGLGDSFTLGLGVFVGLT